MSFHRADLHKGGSLIDPATLPPRLHMPQVLELAGYGRTTLWSRQKAGEMPMPIDRGPRGGIFNRDAVLSALGIADNVEQEERDPWIVDPDALRKAFAGPVCRSQKESGR